MERRAFPTAFRCRLLHDEVSLIAALLEYLIGRFSDLLAALVARPTKDDLAGVAIHEAVLRTRQEAETANIPIFSPLFGGKVGVELLLKRRGLREGF